MPFAAVAIAISPERAGPVDHAMPGTVFGKPPT